jgi:peptide/nickel transport system substrate-binding protein
MRARSGQPLAFELTTYPQRPELTLMATVIQSQLAELGMAVTLRQVEQITPVVNNRDYQASMYRLGTAPTADPGFVLNTVYASWGADNVQLGYSSPALDALVVELNGVADPARRYELGLAAQALLREEVPSVFLLSPRLHIGLSPRVQNFQYHPFDFYLVNHALALA